MNVLGRDKALPLLLLAALQAAPVLAGFAGTDVFLPSVGRRPGNFGSQYYTMLWIHNPSASTANVTIAFLLRNQPNPTPSTFLDSIPPGDSRSYPDTITTLFSTQAWGALRITANVRVLAVCRMYNLPAGGQDKDTQGQGYNAIPASFAIGSGQSTKLLGVSQTNPKEDSQFRYSFGWVEAAGGTADVQVIAYDETGTQVASKTYPPTGAYEPRYYAIEDLYPTVNSTDLTLQVSVVSGTGKVIPVGSGTANVSNDSTTFEMQFADSLLDGTGGLSAVTHDASLTGDGTSGAPLGIANGQVVRSLNGLHEAVTLAAGANITVTPSGQTLTIAAPGGGGGSGVTSVNGITGAVTVSGSGSAIVSTVGNTVTVSSPSTYAGSTSMGGPASDLSCTGCVASSEINAVGSSSGQVLTSNGSAAAWQNAAAGLTLPYSGTASLGTPAFWVTNSGSGTAVGGTASSSGAGVYGLSISGSGLYGKSTSAEGVRAESSTGDGVAASTGSGKAVHATTAGTGYGVYAESVSQTAIYGVSSGGGRGVHGAANSTHGAVEGWNTGAGAGVWAGNAAGPVGYLGNSTTGVYGSTNVNGYHAIFGEFTGSGAGVGVMGNNVVNGCYGELGTSSMGVYGHVNVSGRTAVYGYQEYIGGNYAGYFHGNVSISGTISKGGGSFRIDHPLDPEHKVLSHSFVESPDMKNIYDGTTITDAEGRAVVRLPEWFEALNRDFRYQLTVIGRFAQAIVEQEITDNRFVIRTNFANVKVSWQVTGIRKDPFANANRIPVEEEKPPEEQGLYLHPAAWGQPEEKGVEWARWPELVPDAEAHHEATEPPTP